MRTIECAQGSEQWLNAHIGVPSASSFDRILTKGGNLSAQADKYLAELVAGWVLKIPMDSYVTQFMERGTDLEGQARAFYEFQRDTDVKQVGFCLLDDADIGCSPDGLVGDDGLLEIKCPSAAIHVAYMLGLDDVAHKYRVQAQGQLWVTGRAWVDVLSYSPVPELPNVIQRTKRDEEFIALMDEAVREFAVRLEAAKLRLLEMTTKDAAA